MLEADILEVQKRLAELGPGGDAGRVFAERELQTLRESGPALSGKLALHEILAEKLMTLERTALRAFGRSGDRDLPSASLSRLPSLLQLLEELQSLHLTAAGDPARGGGTQHPPPVQHDTSSSDALAEARRECAALTQRLVGAEVARTNAEADLTTGLAAAESRGEEEDRVKVALDEADEACVALASSQASLEEALQEARTQRTEVVKLRAEVSKLQAQRAAVGDDSTLEVAVGDRDGIALSDRARSDAEARAELAEQEASSQLEAAAAARTRTDALAAQMESLRQRLTTADEMAERAADLEEQLTAEREAREVAERLAESSRKALDQHVGKDDESFEAVLV